MSRFYHAPLKLIWRTVILIVGLAVLLAGIVMIFTPGPAFICIPAGLAILATEFAWARDLLHRARPMVDAARQKANQVAEARRARKAAKSAGSAPAAESCSTPSSLVPTSSTSGENAATSDQGPSSSEPSRTTAGLSEPTESRG